MLRKLIVAIVLLLQIGLSFAQNSVKPPPSPFSFQNGNTSVNNINSLPSAGLPDVSINDSMPILPANTNANPVNTDPDTIMGDTKKYLDNLSEKLLDPVTQKLYKYGDTLRKAALRLFLYLFGFAILFRFIKFLKRGEYDLKLWLVDTVFMIIFMQIAMYMIKNANVINTQIISWFSAIAGEATRIKEFKPSILLDLSMDYFTAQVKFVISMSFNDLLKGLLLITISGITAFTLCLMVILYLKALIESIIVAQFSVLFLGFLGLEQTRDIGTRPIFQWINIGVKLMFLQMMLGLEHELLVEFINKDEINVASAISVLFVSVFMLLITWEIPNIFEKIITGSTSINYMSQQVVSSVNKLVSEMKKGGLTGNIVRSGLNAGVGTAQSIGGVQQALQAYDNYISSQVNNSSDGISSNKSIADTKNNGFSSANNISNTGNAHNPNSSMKNSIFAPIEASPPSANTSSINNTQSASNNSNQTSSHTNKQGSTSSTTNNTSSSFDKVKGFSTGIKDMIKEKYSTGVNNTIGGKLAQHFDNKTKANNEITDKASIDAYYKDMWSKPEQKNVNAILEEHKQDKEGK